jgi:hypothetical protein
MMKNPEHPCCSTTTTEEKEWWDDSPMFHKTPEEALAAMAAQVTPIGSRQGPFAFRFWADSFFSRREESKKER